LAAGEYVSVSSQADTEHADLDRERAELAADPQAEEDELTPIYVGRGLDADLDRQVARQLERHDALTSHARDELGISHFSTARPVQATLASAACFTVGAILPVLIVFLAPRSLLAPLVSGASLAFLALQGAIGARAGGANGWRAMACVTFWGAFAMALTAGIGAVFGTAV
jgi:VIT1/CCC1 family predicted Fe2+/Mn2+ transporter